MAPFLLRHGLEGVMPVTMMWQRQKMSAPAKNATAAIIQSLGCMVLMKSIGLS
jgi:hypothetical protein